MSERKKKKDQIMESAKVKSFINTDEVLKIAEKVLTSSRACSKIGDWIDVCADAEKAQKRNIVDSLMFGSLAMHEAVEGCRKALIANILVEAASAIEELGGGEI